MAVPDEAQEEIFDEFGVVVEVSDEPSGQQGTSTPAPEAPAPDVLPSSSGGSVDLVDDAGPDAVNGGIGIDTERELRETKERLLRLAADFENFRKRQERERQDHTRFANERLLRELLPVVDNLERAWESARRSAEAPAITAGLELILQEFLRALQRAGAEVIDALGKPFDPALHEALQQVESETVEPGNVATEILRGYTLNGRVLRPALVAVAAAPEITSPGIKALDNEPN